MSARLKFNLVSKSTTNYGKEDLFNVKFSPVTGNSGSDEDKEFYRYSPSGTLEFNTINKHAADSFEFGRSYYLDITEAPA